jgi:hypothetical protein
VRSHRNGLFHCEATPVVAAGQSDGRDGLSQGRPVRYTRFESSFPRQTARDALGTMTASGAALPLLA